ncbi:MAG: HNH endonuclease, partial [bacterium]|nr:HNH endonuclease [bacterium]
PVIADIARQVTNQQHNAEWRFPVTDPDTGAVIDNRTTRRRPTAHQTRHIESRTRTCIFPGCRMPATESDIDHTTPHSDGGPTETENLAPLCRHDHTTRHQHGWTYTPQPGGDYQWTTKLGHTYTTSGTPP